MALHRSAQSIRPSVNPRPRGDLCPARSICRSDKVHFRMPISDAHWVDDRWHLPATMRQFVPANRRWPVAVRSRSPLIANFGTAYASDGATASTRKGGPALATWPFPSHALCSAPQSRVTGAAPVKLFDGYPRRNSHRFRFAYFKQTIRVWRDSSNARKSVGELLTRSGTQCRSRCSFHCRRSARTTSLKLKEEGWAASSLKFL